MELGSLEVQCGYCKCSLVGPTAPKLYDRLRCSKCGNSDTVENIAGIVGEFLKEFADSLMKSGRPEAVRWCRDVTFTSGLEPKWQHRFIVALETAESGCLPLAEPAIGARRRSRTHIQYG